MEYSISWPTQYTVGETTYYLHQYLNQNLDTAEIGMSYLKLGMDTEGGDTTTELISPRDASATTYDIEYDGSPIGDTDVVEYAYPGYQYRQYSPLKWDTEIEPEPVFQIIWPSAYEYNGIVYYMLKYRNQADASALYVERTASTESTEATTLVVTTVSAMYVPTTDYISGIKVPDYEIETFPEAKTKVKRFYSSKPFDNEPDTGEDGGRERTAASSAAIPANYFSYTNDLMTDVYAHLRNNVSDCAMMLETALLGRNWVRESTRDVSDAGFKQPYQWFSTVGQVRAYKAGDYNLDAVGVYSTALCARGLAELCIYKRWSFQLLIHLCLTMMASKFDITEQAEYIETTDTEFVTGKTYYERKADDDLGTEIYVKTTDKVMDPYKKYYTHSNAFLSGRTYVRSIEHSWIPTTETLPATASDPERDYYYIPIASRAVVNEKIDDEFCRYYSFDKESGTFEPFIHLYCDPDSHTGEGTPFRDNYYAFIPHYTEIAKGTVVDSSMFTAGTAYYHRDDDAMMSVLNINNLIQLQAAVDEATVYFKSYEVVTSSMYSEMGVYYVIAGYTYLVTFVTSFDADTVYYELVDEKYVKTTDSEPVSGKTYYIRTGGDYTEITLKNKTAYNAAVESYGEVYRKGSFRSLASRHTHGIPHTGVAEDFAINGLDIYVRRYNDGTYYFKPVGNAGRYRTIVPGYTRENYYSTDVNDCHIWRAAVSGDVVRQLYSDKTNENLDMIRRAVNTFLSHYSQAMLMLRRDPPLASAIPATQPYTVGDLVNRINAIVVAINVYADPEAGLYPIELLATDEYNIRPLKLKCNEIVDLIKHDPNFLEACARICDDTHTYAEFLPGDSMFIYNTLVDRAKPSSCVTKYDLTDDKTFVDGKTYYEYLPYTVTGDTTFSSDKEYFERFDKAQYWVSLDTKRNRVKTYYESITPYYAVTTDKTMSSDKTYYKYVPESYSRTVDTSFVAGKTYYEYSEYQKYTKSYFVYGTVYYERTPPSCEVTTDTKPVPGKQYYIYVGGTCTPVSVKYFDPDKTYYEHVDEMYVETTDASPVSGKTYYTYVGPHYFVTEDGAYDVLKEYYERKPDEYVESTDTMFKYGVTYYELIEYAVSTDNPLVEGKTYYEYSQFMTTRDTTMDRTKTYYERNKGDFLITLDTEFDSDKNYYEKVEYDFTSDYNDLGYYYNPANQACIQTFDKLDWSKPCGVEVRTGAIGYKDPDDTNSPLITYTSDLTLVPLGNVIDVRRIAHAWHECDYNACMQVIRLTGSDLDKTDEDGVPWYQYLLRVTVIDEEKGDLAPLVLEAVKELLRYIEKLLQVGPVAANYVVDIFRRTMEYGPCMADKIDFSEHGAVS